MTQLLLSCLLLSITITLSLSYSCLNPHGDPVDWFLIQKIPTIDDSSNPLIADGVAHFYMDNTNTQWILSDVSLKESRGHAFFHTLNQLYKSETLRFNDEATAYVLFNDEKPNSKEWTEKYGHTKGVIGFTKSGGFWLSHTIPKFPQEVSEGYDFPHNAHRYGQSALCVSLHYKYLDVIGKQFRYTYPWVYDQHLPDSLATENPILASYLRNPNRAHVRKAPWFSTVTIESQAGLQFTSFAKFTDFNEDLYGALISQTLNTSFYVESWLHQKSEMFYSNCTNDYRVYNVAELSFPQSVSWENYDDHSKWGVAKGTDKGPLLCMADINRVETQLVRGGGALCFVNEGAWKGFHSAVTKSCDCDDHDCA